MIFWAVTGSIATRYFYLRRDLDTSNAPFVGAMLGASTGPFGLVPLCIDTPDLTTRFTVMPNALMTMGAMRARLATSLTTRSFSSCVIPCSSSPSTLFRFGADRSHALGHPRRYERHRQRVGDVRAPHPALPHPLCAV